MNLKKMDFKKFNTEIKQQVYDYFDNKLADMLILFTLLLYSIFVGVVLLMSLFLSYALSICGLLVSPLVLFSLSIGLILIGLIRVIGKVSSKYIVELITSNGIKKAKEDTAEDDQ